MGVVSSLVAGTIGTTVLLGGAAYGATAMATQKKPAAPSAPALPAMPNSGGEATSAEKARIRRKTKTILTSPLRGDEFYGSSAPTLLGSGDVTKKTILG